MAVHRFFYVISKPFIIKFYSVFCVITKPAVTISTTVIPLYRSSVSRYELYHAKYVSDLPKGMHSTKGCGMCHPDPKDTLVTDDGMIVPLGKGVDSKIGQSSLLYNEYPFHQPCC